MLILTRKLGESVVIGNDIVVTVSDIKNGQIQPVQKTS
jgi:carbon storage regulator CsrA